MVAKIGVALTKLPSRKPGIHSESVHSIVCTLLCQRGPGNGLNMKSIVLLLVILITTSALADDWRAIRGNAGTGVVDPGEVLASGQPVTLQVAWKKKIGSGYSSVVVANGFLLVLYSEDKDDVIACLNTSSGETVWKKPIGPKFVGKNGSFDGPLATPLADGELVFVLSPLGKLFCFRLDDGSEVWSRDLQEQDSAPLPMYGFTTSPVVYNDKLFVQTGVKGKSLGAFDKMTGAPVWSCTDDAINSQTPTMTTLGSQPILLVAGGKNLAGVNPEDGKVLFEYAHEGGNGSAMMPVVFDQNKVLLTLDDRFSKAVSLRPVGDQVNVSEEWQQPTIKNTYNVPAVYDGHAYAFSTRILTSVDTATGRANWKSRKPGDGFLIVVDGHMIISTKKGGLTIAGASPEQYQPVAEIKVFDDLVWSIPAYSQNSVYLRSLGEVARVDIVPVEKSLVAGDAGKMPLGKEFSRFIDTVVNARENDRVKIIDRFLNSNRMPLIEGNIVHFVYRGRGDDVAVASDVFGARQERKMKRLGDSDLYYYSIELPADQRANYVFAVDYVMTPDANNMNRLVTSSVYAGEMEFAVRLSGEDPLQMNWFAMNEWKEPPFLSALDSEPPELITVSLEAAKDDHEDSDDSNQEQSLPRRRPQPPVEYRVLLPPDYESQPDRRYRVVYVLAGSQAIRFGSMPVLLNDIFEHHDQTGYQQIDPCIVVFTDNAGPALVEKIVPSVDEKYRTIASRDGRSLIGNSFLAGPGFSAVIQSSDVFSGFASQSPLMFDAAKDALRSQIPGLNKPIRVYVDWGNFDMFNPDENWDVRSDAREVHELLSSHEKIQLIGGEVHDSTDWSSWRNRLDKILKHITGS